MPSMLPKLFEESYALAEQLFLTENKFIEEHKPTPQVLLIGIAMFAHVQIKEVMNECVPKAQIVAQALISPIVKQLADFVALIQSFESPKEG